MQRLGCEVHSGRRRLTPPPSHPPPIPPLLPPQRQREQQALGEFVLAHISPACGEELKVVLQTPPESQTQDQLTDTCRAEVQKVRRLSSGGDVCVCAVECGHTHRDARQEQHTFECVV
jgi:hypothetical protein